MRIVSLHPAATEIVFALGLAEELAGVTAACTQPWRRDIDVVTHRRLPPRALPCSAAVAGARRRRAPRRGPGPILCSDTSRVCAVNLRELRRSPPRSTRRRRPRLDPVSVEGVLNAISSPAP
ncbi:MAG: hypothetical protein U0838_07125 [Chloroflexota bacterium]